MKQVLQMQLKTIEDGKTEVSHLKNDLQEEVTIDDENAMLVTGTNKNCVTVTEEKTQVNYIEMLPQGKKLTGGSPSSVTECVTGVTEENGIKKEMILLKSELRKRKLNQM